MLILSELIVAIVGGVLRLLEAVLLVGSGLVVASPEVAGPGYAAGRSSLLRLLTWPIRAAVANPRRLALLLAAVAVAVGVVALSRP